MTHRHRRPPRILYLAFFFPPSRASGVYRARATANMLATHGWDVTVLASPLRFLHEVIGSVDEGLAETVDPRIHVERPELNLFAWEKDIRRFSRFRRAMPTLARSLYFLGQRRLFPEHYSSWGLHAVRRALKLHMRKRFDVVLATGNPFASFMAAYLFHKLTGVPYVIDNRDSWTLDLFADAPAHPPKHPVWKWENRILRDASGASFVNEALRSWHAGRYPRYADKMMVIPNGWDPDLLSVLTDEVPSADVAFNRPLRFTYLGIISNAQPLEELVSSWETARRHPTLADAELHLYGHLGFFHHSKGVIRDRLGLGGTRATEGAGDNGIHYRGAVSKTDVGRVYEDSDVLVFMAGGAKYVTSGKIFEYMAAGHPIVSVHAPGIAATEVLDGYPLWFNANSLDPQEIAETMIAAGKAARDMTPQLRAAARLHSQKYSREKVLAPLDAKLRAVIGWPIPIANGSPKDSTSAMPMGKP
jgi:glycosyltransferase involved in cell wall biosynthesis